VEKIFYFGFPFVLLWGKIFSPTLFHLYFDYWIGFLCDVVTRYFKTSYPLGPPQNFVSQF